MKLFFFPLFEKMGKTLLIIKKQGGRNLIIQSCVA